MQRALKFARYLPDVGWQPTVLTVRPEQAAYPDFDSSLLREVPSSVQVERTASWDPYALYARLLGKEKQDTVSVAFLGEAEPSRKERLARWLRANLFLPDARMGWVPFAIARGRKLLHATPHDALFTTGPPHSTHLAGLVLSRLTGTPWVADFRDLWTGIDYADKLPTTAPARRIDAALERLVLRSASAVTVVSPSWKRALARRAVSGSEQVPLGCAEGRYVLLRNGFDPVDFSAEAPPRDATFSIAYLGNLHDARNPTALWQALQRLEATHWTPPPRVRLVGNVDPAVLRAARRFGLESLVEAEDYVPHGEAVRQMRQSALLLLVIDRVANQEGRIPGKLYEYVASGRPVLGLGPPTGDAAALLEETGAGRMFAPDDVEGVAASLKEHHTAFQDGDPQAGASAQAAAPYSRQEQTKELAALLDTL